MPIDHTIYPPDWQERRARVLERDKYRCRRCGVPQYGVGWRDAKRRFVPAGGNIALDAAGQGFTEDGQRLTFKQAQALARALTEATDGQFRFVVIVLTVAHLDHDPENWKVKDERLEALCQQCHLRLDAPMKAAKRLAKKRQRKLF